MESSDQYRNHDEQYRETSTSRGAQYPADVERSPFFRPSTPHTFVKVQSPGGTRRLQKKKLKKSDEAKAGIWGTVANLVTTIVGSGIVGIPFAIRESGLVAGTFMVLFCALLTDKSLRLLIETGKHVDVPSYETLMEAAFGRFGFIFISINMFISAFGGMVSYLIIIKDTIPLLFGVDIDNEPVKRAILVVTSMTISLPLAMQRDMANLSKTSAISAVFDTLMVGIIAFFSPVRESTASAGGIGHVLSHSVIQPDTIFIGLGVLSFAFVCQDSCFIMAGSLDSPTKERWGKVTGAALTFCAFLATTCGVCGYLAFQRDTEGNVLNNFEDPSTHIAATAARALLGSTMFFVYPLASYVARHVMVVLLFQGRQAHEGDDHMILARRDRRVALTLLIYVLALVPAIFFDDLGTVLAVAGAIAGSCLSYIGPGATYLAVHGGEFLELVSSLFGNNKFSAFLLGYPDASRLNNVEDIACQNAETSQNEEAELTPLVTSGVGYPFDDIVSGETEGSPSSKESLPANLCAYVCSAVGFISWYLLLFPIWSSLASYGMHRFADYKTEQSAKSPRPNRLGRVARTRNSDSVQQRMLIPPQPQQAGDFLRRTDSAPLGSYGTVSDVPSQRVEKETPKAIPLSKGTVSVSVSASANSLLGQDGTEGEIDPQKGFPSIYDFFVAIGFSVLGAVAMIVGISSIVMNS